MNLLFCLLVGLGLASGNIHPVVQTAKIPKIEGLKRLRRNREGNTWLTNGIHWLIGTYIFLERTQTPGMNSYADRNSGMIIRILETLCFMTSNRLKRVTHEKNFQIRRTRK